MSLYEISGELYAVINGGYVFDDDGVIIFDSTNLEQLEAEYKDKLEGCALYVKNLQADIDALKKEEVILAERRKRKENKVSRMKDYMLSSIVFTKTEKLETTKVVISKRKASHVEVTDEAALKRCAPMCFTPQPDKLDKKLLRKMMNEGGTIEGAELVEKASVVIK